ncbi:MAG TPA: uroporphyrinogen-III synthase [Burkholderiales bacterium]
MSFAGRGVVVTRPKDLAEPLARLIEARGGRAILFPVIEIEPLPAPAALARLAQFDIAVFVSPSAVRVALPAVGAWPRRVRAAAIGSGTRRELERGGVPDVLAPVEGADSEALLALPAMHEVAGKRVLIVRGEGGRPLLAESLAARGASVEYAQCYRRAKSGRDPAPLAGRWKSGEVDAATAYSAQGVDNLLAIFGADLVAATPLFVPHERVASHALQLGIRQAIVAGPGDGEMIERLVAYFHERT